MVVEVSILSGCDFLPARVQVGWNANPQHIACLALNCSNSKVVPWPVIASFDVPVLASATALSILGAAVPWICAKGVIN